MAEASDSQGWVSGDWRTWPVPKGRLGEDFPDGAAVPASPEARLAAAFELSDAALDRLRAGLRREVPGGDPALVAEGVRAWLLDRPGAGLGDGVGRPVTWPRPLR